MSYCQACGREWDKHRDEMCPFRAPQVRTTEEVKALFRTKYQPQLRAALWEIGARLGKVTLEEAEELLLAEGWKPPR